MKFLYHTIVVFSFVFILTKSEESCQETISEKKTYYIKEFIQSGLEDHRYWKKYDKNTLDFLANPLSEFLLTLEPIGKLTKNSITVKISITQFQKNETFLVQKNFQMKIVHSYTSGKIF